MHIFKTSWNPLNPLLHHEDRGRQSGRGRAPSRAALTAADTLRLRVQRPQELAFLKEQMSSSENVLYLSEISETLLSVILL